MRLLYVCVSKSGRQRFPQGEGTCALFEWGTPLKSTTHTYHLTRFSDSLRHTSSIIPTTGNSFLIRYISYCGNHRCRSSIVLVLQTQMLAPSGIYLQRFDTPFKNIQGCIPFPLFFLKELVASQAVHSCSSGNCVLAVFLMVQYPYPKDTPYPAPPYAPCCMHGPQTCRKRHAKPSRPESSGVGSARPLLPTTNLRLGLGWTTRAFLPDHGNM